MSEFTGAAGFDVVTLVDRAMLGNTELIHDGVRVVFKPGQIERPVPQFFVEWLSRVDQGKVHTKDGDYVRRFAVKDASPELAAIIGREMTDCSPIEIDTERLEGWDVEASADAADRGNTRTINLKRQRADFASDAAPAGAAFGTR